MRLPDVDTRLGELLADRALSGLAPEESTELDRLLAEMPDVDEWALDRAATALMVGLGGLQLESPPASVRISLHQAAEDWVERAPVQRRREDDEPVVARIGSSWGGWGWLAAAACLAIALVAWWPALRSGANSSTPAVGQADLVRLAWSAGPDQTGQGVTGEVVWSDETQSGYMEFRGLPALDRTQWQYQLWIVDPERDKHPVDGGVFDIPADASGVVRVPIQAKLRVDDPAAFVVTVEQPGGVVVSSQERVALIAAAKG